MNESSHNGQNDKPQGKRNPRAASNQEGLSNYVFGKVQPQAIPLEEAVLGALMLDREALPLVMDILRPESFYLEAHQHIYRAIIRLFERSNPVDILTVTEEMRKSGELDKVNGGYYLVELTHRVASAANIEYHARIIAQKHIQRELISVSTRTIRDAYEDTTDVFTLLDDAEKGLFNITQNNLSRSYESMGSLSSKVLKQIEELAGKTDGLTGVPTGFTDLDRLTSGWQPSDLVIMAARPGMGKCLGKGTRVLMYDGSLKKVEDIVSGDLLMGDDSTPRRVLSTATGREKMYWIRQNKGIDYRVNESHILVLKPSATTSNTDTVEISVLDWLNKDPKFRTKYKGYKVAVEFAEQPLSLPPYFLGLWLGDGSSSRVDMPAGDTGIVTYLEEFATRHAYKAGSNREAADFQIYSASHPAQNGHSLLGELSKIGVLNSKHIPREYLVNSRNNRLELLAGLIDAAGHDLGHPDGYEIRHKNENLAQQIKFLCDSLGFRSSLSAKKARGKSNKPDTTTCRLRLYGNVGEIPVKLAQKVNLPWKSPVKWQVTGITVEPDIEDDYYGFELEGNGRFLLEDMTVTHNTSMVLAMMLNAAKDFSKPVAMFSLEMASTQLVQRLISMEAEIPGSKMRNGKLEDYEWQQLQSTVERLNSVPIFIDDTPGINIFELRAKCRRLKQQHDIQMVIIDYLQLMTGSSEGRNSNREQEIAGISRALKSLAKELNVPVIALSQLSRAVEVRGGSKRPQLSDLRESGCLTGETLIMDAATGRRIPIRTLAERQQQDTIAALGMTDDLKVLPQHMVKVFYSGKKQVFELKTHTGRTIKASANHPFFKLEGWTSLEDLKPGDRIAMPRKITVAEPGNPLSEAELILLAHLIGDGCILPKTPYHYTSADPANIRIVNSCAKELFGIEGKIVAQSNWWHTYLTTPYRLTHRVKHPLTNWYEKLGLERVRSYEKRLPDALFACDETRLALFLHHLWATDGNISWKTTREGRNPAPAIYYGTTSEVLAEQVQHLLLRLGIQSSVRLSRKGNYRPSFNLFIEGKESQVQFLTRVGCHGERGIKIPAMLLAMEAIDGNPNADTIPKEAWQQVIAQAKAGTGLSWRDFSSKLEMSYCGSTLFKHGISRQRMDRIGQFLPDDRILNLTGSDVFWDKIKSITPLGVEDVYDATVLDVHNFVANDFIVHNSIEQDADIVSFIYRPEYYNILEDENGQSLKGIAEIIIAKHRHGALETVRLKFTDTFAKFGNLDDPAFAGLHDPLTGPFSPSVITMPSRMNEEDIPF